MLFITNRFPVQGIRSVAGRTLNFALQDNTPISSVFFCETGPAVTKGNTKQRNEKRNHTEIGSQEFLKRLKDSDYRQILLYIHGFSNLPEDVFETAQKLQDLCDAKKEKEVLVVPLIWPCDNDIGIVQDYWDDQKSADRSADSFARALERFMAWRNSDGNKVAPCLKRINLLAHSMGNRVLRQSLVMWDRYDLASGVPLILRNTFMVAADVVNETLHRGQPGELISHASRNVVVYYASDDMALRASKAANLKNKVASRRLGHTGPEDISKTPRNVFQADCDDINTDYDMLMGHTYFLDGDTAGQPGLVFEHMFRCISFGRVFPDDPDQRSIIL